MSDFTTLNQLPPTEAEMIAEISHLLDLGDERSHMKAIAVTKNMICLYHPKEEPDNPNDLRHLARRIHELSPELRNSIYEFCLPTEPDTRAVLGPSLPDDCPLGSGIVDKETVAYSAWKLDLTPRRMSPQICSEFEYILKQQLLKRHPLSMQIALSHGDGELEPTCPQDRFFCTPAPSPNHGSSEFSPILQARTITGLLLLAATEMLPLRNSHYATDFALDLNKATYLARLVLSSLVLGRVSPGNEIEYDLYELELSIRPFLHYAMMCLSLNRKVVVYAALPPLDDADRCTTLNFVHDMRYLADNRIMEVEVRVQAEISELEKEEWVQFFANNGGKVTWVF